MIYNRILISIIASLMVFGCQTAPARKTSHARESSKEMLNAVGEVAGVLAGQELTDEQKKKLVRDIQKDKDAQSALRAISGAMDIKQTAVKYCPVDGKRYSHDLQICPEHKVKLQELVD
jgi:hypothetical protein